MIPKYEVGIVGGELKINIDTRNEFTYAEPKHETIVKNAFIDILREYKGAQVTEELKIKAEKEIEDFLRDCVARRLIIEKEVLDKMYTNRMECGGPRFSTNSFVKTI